MSPFLASGLKTHFSDVALARLAAAKVGIAGAGGLGSNVAMLLVRTGVQRLVLVDADKVEPSNLNRQFYWPEDVGRAKVLALRDRLHALEPHLDCVPRHEWIRPATAPALFQGCSVVVEALDDAGGKAALCASLLSAGFFVVAASGLAGFGLSPLQVRRMGTHFVCVGDFTTAVNCQAPPLAPRVMQAAALQADAVVEKILTGA